MRRSLVLATALLATGAGSAAAAVPQGWEVVATGLDNPRGVAFGKHGEVLVAEAGRGGDSTACRQGPEGGQECLGATGAVTAVWRNGQKRVVTGLPSLAGEGGAAATGPQGLGIVDGRLWISIGLGGDAAGREALGADAALLGTVVSIGRKGHGHRHRGGGGGRPAGPRVVADLVAYEQAENPDGGVPDSNPFGLLPWRGGAAVADAGGNDVLHVSRKGGIRTLATFPDVMVPAPSAGEMPMQAVPTALAATSGRHGRHRHGDRGRGGSLLVGQLTGFPFPPGGASIFRIGKGGTTSVVAAGLTNVLGLATDRRGAIYAVEYQTAGILSGITTGSVVRIAKDGTRTVIASEGLVQPAGIAIRGRYAYVANHSSEAGAGELVRFRIG